jgi:hypothetical protein
MRQFLINYIVARTLYSSVNHSGDDLENGLHFSSVSYPRAKGCLTRISLESQLADASASVLYLSLL